MIVDEGTGLRVERDGPIVRLTLNRPTAGNALDLPLARSLRESAAEATSDDTCAVVLIAAEGPLFCGGGDLAAMSASATPAEYVNELAATVHEALLTLASSDKVVIGAVQGPAAGGGVGLVMNCDYVVAADSSTFVSAYSRVALSPDCGLSYLLPRIAGPTRATEFALCGRALDAATAREWGIVSAIEAPDGVSRAALRVAEKVAAIPTAARGATKKLLAAAWLPGYREHLEQERHSISRLAATAESAALRAAFVRKDRGGRSEPSKSSAG